ncbi:MAG: hypothetical protein N3G78_07835 [Desulfobacterota bacterium]|nr:hypothetical protein [Thermodesulfobacteriota bacterium]
MTFAHFSRQRGPRKARTLFHYGAGLILISSILFQSLDALGQQMPRLVILPFFVEREASCPVCKVVFRRGEIHFSGPGTATRLLYQKIGAMGSFALIPQERVEEALSSHSPRAFEEEPRSSSIELGKELRSDFVLVGFLFRFEERVGSSVGVERPASVGFDLHLFRVKDGKEVWRGRMDETQRPLSENLFKMGSFFRRKARWLTAEELTRVGMEEVFRRFPGGKELEERR